MDTKKQPGKKPQLAVPLEIPQTEIPVDPEEPIISTADPDIIPDDDPFTITPEEMPAAGEGP